MRALQYITFIVLGVSLVGPDPARAGSCPSVPDPTCTQPRDLRKASLSVSTTNGRHKVTWRWEGFADFDDLVDPTDTDHDFCVYVEEAGETTLLVDAKIPAGENWKVKPLAARRSAKYKSNDKLPDGIQSVRFREGRVNTSKLILKGKGENLAVGGPLGFNQNAVVKAQLRSGPTDECFGSKYEPLFQIDQFGRFKDKSDEGNVIVNEPGTACVRYCTEDAGCEGDNGDTCVDNRCVVSCETDRYCQMVFEDQGPCVQDSECNAGRICVDVGMAEGRCAFPGDANLCSFTLADAIVVNRFPGGAPVTVCGFNENFCNAEGACDGKGPVTCESGGTCLFDTNLAANVCIDGECGCFDQQGCFGPKQVCGYPGPTREGGFLAP